MSNHYYFVHAEKKEVLDIGIRYGLQHGSKWTDTRVVSLRPDVMEQIDAWLLRLDAVDATIYVEGMSAGLEPWRDEQGNDVVIRAGWRFSEIEWGGHSDEAVGIQWGKREVPEPVNKRTSWMWHGDHVDRVELVPQGSQPREEP